MATKKIKKKIQYLGTGRRKKSIARVRLIPGGGKITINKRDIDEYFGLETMKLIVNQPFGVTNTRLFLLCCLITLAGFALCYVAVYAMTSRKYYSIVKR